MSPAVTQEFPAGEGGHCRSEKVVPKTWRLQAAGTEIRTGARADLAPWAVCQVM